MLRKVPDNLVSWNIDAIVLMESEKALECLVLKLAVYGFKPSPRERLEVITHCMLEIFSLVFRLHIKLLVEGPHEVHLVLSQVTFGQPFEAKSIFLKLLLDVIFS